MDRLLDYGSDSDDSGSDPETNVSEASVHTNDTTAEPITEQVHVDDTVCSPEPIHVAEQVDDTVGSPEPIAEQVDDTVGSPVPIAEQVDDTGDVGSPTQSGDKVGDTGKAKDSDGTKHDFFGLFSGDDDNVDNEDKSDVAERQAGVVQVDGQKLSVGIPSSSFWSDVHSSDLHVMKETGSKFVLDKRKRLDIEGYQGRHKTRKITYGTRHPQNVHMNASARAHQTEKAISGESLITNKSTGTSEVESSVQRKLYFIHSKIQPLLYTRRQKNRIPSSLEWSVASHGGAVNRLKWNIPAYSHLLATCSMDSSVKIWNPWTQLEPCVQVVNCHRKAVRDVDWSRDGKQLLSSSYDKTAAVTDVEKGTTLCRFHHTSYVTCGKFHPSNPSYCLTGCKNKICAWDLRTPEAPVRQFRYKDNIGQNPASCKFFRIVTSKLQDKGQQVQDLLFPEDESCFFSCSDLVSRDSADRNLMAWDFKSGVTLSNQIYQERYTITRLKQHPTDRNLLAQSSGNYIAIFSSNRPYKMNKSKRFDGHKLLGYSVGFDITPDGANVCSGSCDGNIYFYDYRSAKLLRKLPTSLDIVMDVACHPVLPSTVACCSWDGTVQVWR